jgi:hypothetical protein
MRIKVMGVLSNETRASTLAMTTALRSSEEWVLKRYLAMNNPQKGRGTKPTISRH